MARMGYQLKSRKPVWREYLTEAEFVRVGEIERSPKPSAAMQLEFIKLRTRACQRIIRKRKQEKAN